MGTFLVSDENGFMINQIIFNVVSFESVSSCYSRYYYFVGDLNCLSFSFTFLFFEIKSVCYLKLSNWMVISFVIKKNEKMALDLTIENFFERFYKMTSN